LKPQIDFCGDCDNNNPEKLPKIKFFNYLFSKIGNLVKNKNFRLFFSQNFWNLGEKWRKIKMC
jgi:hypothetical protein